MQNYGYQLWKHGSPHLHLYGQRKSWQEPVQLKQLFPNAYCANGKFAECDCNTEATQQDDPQTAPVPDFQTRTSATRRCDQVIRKQKLQEIHLTKQYKLLNLQACAMHQEHNEAQSPERDELQADA